MKNFAAPAFLLLFSFFHVSGVEIAIAPLVSTGEAVSGTDMSESIAESVASLGSRSSFGITVAGKPNDEIGPRSILDAADWCENLGADVLVYGTVRFSEDVIDGELHVFDAKTKSVAKTLVGRDERDRKDRLLQHLAEKLYAYFSEELGLAMPMTPLVREKTTWDFRAGLGWWTAAGHWNDALCGLFTLDFGAALTPVRPLHHRGAWDYFVRFGVDIAYEAGMGRPGVEPYFFHGLLLGLPVDACAEWRRTHQVRMTLKPVLFLDAMRQDRLYGGEWSGVSAMGGLSLAVSYAFGMDEHSSLGLAFDFSMVFYDPVRFRVRPSIFYEFTIPGKEETL